MTDPESMPSRQHAPGGGSGHLRRGAERLPPKQLVWAQHIPGAPMGPIPVSPAVTVSFVWTGFGGVIQPHAGETTPVEPKTITWDIP